MTRSHFLDNRLPPLLVAAVVGVIMTMAARLTPFPWLVWPGSIIVAFVLVLLGVALAFAGVVTFERHRTTVNPFKPATASTLVEAGVYRRTRNPMYVGVTLMLLGYAVYLGHLLAFVLVALFPIYIQRFQIVPEERALDRIFGDAYAVYKARVPRWF